MLEYSFAPVPSDKTHRKILLNNVVCGSEPVLSPSNEHGATGFFKEQDEKLKDIDSKGRDTFPTQNNFRPPPLRLQIHHGQVNSFQDQEKASC
jgi:hypothetical protein